ncbi:hypothetical protein HDU76_012067, partial [Blyttiomyces sp. JEL0837]
TDLWNVAFKQNLVHCDLGRLPQSSFPTTKTGLLLVNSREMYHKLWLLKPNLVDTTAMKEYLQKDRFWEWFKQDNMLQLLEDPFLVSSSSWNMLIHIPLFNVWTDEFPIWWKDMNDIQKFTIACDAGHINLVRSLLSNLEEHDEFDAICEFGCVDDIEIVISELEVALNPYYEVKPEVAEILVASQSVRNSTEAVKKLLMEFCCTFNFDGLRLFFSLKNRVFPMSYEMLYQILVWAIPEGNDEDYSGETVRFLLAFEEVYCCDGSDLNHVKLIEILRRTGVRVRDLDYGIEYWSEE